MNYLSDSSGVEDNPDSADIQRLHAAWKSVKGKRQSQKKSVSPVKNAIYAEEQKNLQARLLMTEKQLAKARQNTALLMKKLSEGEEELELREFEYLKQKKLREEKEQQIVDLKNRLKRNGKDTSYVEIRQNPQSLKNDFQSLKKKLEIKEKEVDRLCLKIKSLQLDKQSNLDEIKKLQETNDHLIRQLSESQSAINEVYLNDHSKGTQLLQLSEAHKTIERLVLLLRSTEEYKIFGDFAEEAKDIHFLNNIGKRMKNNSLNHKLADKKKMCSCMEIKIDERLLWTPESSYRVLFNMKIKYDSLTQDCIEQALFELNKIWLSKEENHVKRVKDYYEGEIAKLKKKTELRYDQLVARKQIQRLKKEVTVAKNNRKQSKTGQSLENLKNLGQYQDQLRVKEKENRLLQERIRLLEAQSSSSDRVLYLEGALWIIEKVLKQMDINEEDLTEFEGQFRQKISSNLCTEDWIRSFKQFFEVITEINNGLIERLISMRESTLNKISGNKGTQFLITRNE